MDTKTKPRLLVLSVVLLSLYLKSHVSLAVAADTITASQSLSGYQTIVSAGGIFVLGFFKPGKLSNYYIGMWYSEKVVSERTIVWVANRENPISNTFSSVLRISEGNLVLFNEAQIPVWSTNLRISGSVHAVILDSGNLVLRADRSRNSTSPEPLWQSFDHPAHTFLPGGRIGFNKITKQTQILTSWKSSEDPAPGLFSLQLDPNGSSAYLLLWNRSIKYWTSGSWDANTRIFSLVPEMRRNYIYNYSYVTNENESYFTYSLYDPKIVSRCVMSTSGQIQQLTFLQMSWQWNLFWSQPRKQCEVYNLCGAFGSCNEINLPACNCLTGFEPKSQREWDFQAYTGGCSRKTTLQCGQATGGNGTDEYMEIHNMSWPANKQYVEDALYFDAYGCKYKCSNICSCTAWAYGNNTGCSIWIGDLLGVHLLKVGEGDGKVLHIKLAASDITSGGTAHSVAHSVNRGSILIATVSTTAGLLTLVFGYFFWKRTVRKRRKREHRKKYGETIYNFGAGDGEKDTELPLFALRSVLDATNNFSEANKLGEGGFGPVYKGILSANQEVAIKRLSKKSGQGHHEFMNELKLIAKLQHTNLVRLLGCCVEEEEKILIYEFMPNRSLDKLLFDPSEKAELDWAKRFGIIEGIAQGVLYIHKYSRLKIIHRDLKASNVLLDGTMNPKISDFGMAKIFEINQTEANTNRVVGTYGYMSPEYARYGHFSEKLDVFSFGVLLLEIVTGKKNAAFYRFEHSPTLAGWAWELWKEGRAAEVIDESVRETCQPDEALRCIHVGFLCVQEAPADRPKMSSVIRMLHGNEATSLPPSKAPAFSTHRNPSAVESSPHTPAASCFTNNAVTISLPEGR